MRVEARGGRRARGCAAGRTPAPAARPLPLHEDDTRLATVLADEGIKRTRFFH